VQLTVPASTMEAEYVVAEVTTKEAVWLRRLMGALRAPTMPVLLHCDNQSALKLIENHSGTARSKYIYMTHHFVRERVKSRDLLLSCMPSAEIVADILTKALPSAALRAFRAAMGMVQRTAPSASPAGSVESGTPDILAIPRVGNPDERSGNGRKRVACRVATAAP